MSVDSGRQNSVSQEDMIPAVPRNRVRIRIHVLIAVDQIIAQNEYEREALELLKKQSFCHTKIFEPLFIIKTSVETAKTSKIYFRFFDEQYELTAKELSVALGFSKECLLDPNAIIKDYQYDCTTWWNEISEEHVSSKNSIVSIHNPTLRLLAKWLCMVVHPRFDLRLCSLPELQYLFAMAKKMEKKEPARRSAAGPVTQGWVRLSTQQEQAGPSHQAGTSQMNFEETYEHYTQAGASTAGGSTEYGEDQEPYYPPGMQNSYGPQVGPSSSARYGYENPIMRGIMNLTTQVNTLGQQQDQISQDLAHNTDFTQQSWGMNTSMLHDISVIFIHLGLGPNQQQPPPP
ncbi:hypothetical protein C2845_PM14G08480 [Panicum miliaceum]|uniref:Uncharacterized protein n=1 Tax=Panicum miliaceum TaxID=4540 RepID=A0A3L6PQY2_PANMI|nr:hypothetical protein C2845_PM14G08480 [Panicum miliaceum]